LYTGRLTVGSCHLGVVSSVVAHYERHRNVTGILHLTHGSVLLRIDAKITVSLLNEVF